MPGMDGLEFRRHLSGSNYKGVIALVSGVDKRKLEPAKKLIGTESLARRWAEAPRQINYPCPAIALRG